MGLNLHQIAGVMGNLHAESAILPDNVQDGVCPGKHNKYVHDFNENEEHVGFGLLQWSNKARKTALKNMAQSMAFGTSEEAIENACWDINVQLAYFKQEMTTSVTDVTPYYNTWNTIKHTYSYNDVSDLFLKYIEAPRYWETKIDTRRDYSRIVFEAINNPKKYKEEN